MRIGRSWDGCLKAEILEAKHLLSWIKTNTLWEGLLINQPIDGPFHFFYWRSLYFTPSEKLTFDPLRKEDQNADMHPLQNLLKDQRCRHSYPHKNDLNLKDPSPPLQKSRSFNRGADKKRNGPIDDSMAMRWSCLFSWAPSPCLGILRKSQMPHKWAFLLPLSGPHSINLP